MSIRKFLIMLFLLYPMIGSAQDISPSVGLWVIDQENNGQPGRGFEIDVQNDIIVLTFFGYENSGLSTFYQASGQFTQGSNEITMPLNQFENGTAFGQPFQNAESIGSAGDVTFKVFEMDSGEICLPGESCKAVSHLNFGFTPVEELLGEWVVVTDGFDSNVWFFSFNESSGDMATGDATIKTELGDFTVDLFCELDESPEPYRYSCAIEGFGEVERFALNISRNSLAGESSDSEKLLGWRLKNDSGRLVLPN